MSIVQDTAENPSSEKVRLGAGCRVNPPPPVGGENFLLTSPFIECPDHPISYPPPIRQLGFQSTYAIPSQSIPAGPRPRAIFAWMGRDWRKVQRFPVNWRGVQACEVALLGLFCQLPRANYQEPLLGSLCFQRAQSQGTLPPMAEY
jgi:hypothetical protein